MLLSCPNCNTSYDVDRASLGPTGRSVRCLRCRHIWFASNTMAFAAIADAHRADMAALTTGTSVIPAEPPPPEPEVYYTNLAPPSPPASADVAAMASAEPDDIAALDPAGQDSLAPAEDTASPGDLASVAADDAPALAPTEGGDAARDATDSGADRVIGADIESVAARRTVRAAKRRRVRSLQGLTTAILMMIAILTGLIAWRSDVVRVMPQTASLYAAIGMPINLRGLEFENVKTETETQDGVPVLVVSGEILSTSRHAVEVPRLRFAVRDDSGKEIYAWTALPGRTVLGPSAALPFRSRLASPPREGRQVLVRFFNRRDLAAGLQ